MAMARVGSVDEYLALHPEWRGALTKLRRVLVASELEETIKWGAPHYALDGKNVVGLGAFKNHVALWFHNGVHLSDPDAVLINAQEGRTRGLRQWRFASERDIRVARVKVYVQEAIANQLAGRQLEPRRARAVVVPPELEAALRQQPKVQKAFAALTPGRQREYAEFIAEARREATKVARIAKILPMIAAGGGLHDKYRNC